MPASASLSIAAVADQLSGVELPDPVTLVATATPQSEVILPLIDGSAVRMRVVSPAPWLRRRRSTAQARGFYPRGEPRGTATSPGTAGRLAACALGSVTAASRGFGDRVRSPAGPVGSAARPLRWSVAAERQ